MKKFGFTLAEVLITLGVIGIVAAMTLPAIVQNHKRKEATARLKKFYSTMSQAVMLAEGEHGSRAYEWPDISKQYSDGEEQQENDTTYAYWNKYFAKYFKSVKVEKGVYDEVTQVNELTAVYLADGSKFTIHSGKCIDINFDVNGDRKPNEFGRDQFKFVIATPLTFTGDEGSRVWELHQNRSFGVGWLPAYKTREKALSACKADPEICSTLLIYDDFEFKDDYPYNI